jgi:FkbM family methyltransferase
MFYGQLMQDKWVFEQLIRLGNSLPREGYFVDIGCHDGIEINNTIVFERIGFGGICVDANAASIEKCKQNRKCIVEHAMLYGKSGKTLLFSPDDESPMVSQMTPYGQQGIATVTTSLDDLLKKHNAPKEIDYISLDVEGMEMDVIDGFNANEYDVKCWTIEHNGQPRAGEIANWLWNQGYLVRVFEWDFFAVKDTVRLR